MNYARYRSIFKGKKVRIKFDSIGYTIEEYDETQKKWTQSIRNIFEDVVIAANNSPIFHPIGTVSNLASIHISNSWGKYKITLAISGRIKVKKL
jgi:hypothetical protein